MTTMKWYFDTWAPLDGIAFASRRASAAETRNQTVALWPPHWQPAPVSPATAMRAERGGLQVGFYDANGAIAFDTLDALIEAVRQAYLASGIGRGPEGEGPRGDPPGGPPASASMMEVLESPHSGADVLFQTVGGKAEFDRLWEGFGKATVDSLTPHPFNVPPSHDLRDWLDIVAYMGVPYAVAYLVHSVGPMWSIGTAGDAARTMARGLLFRIPYPYVAPASSIPLFQSVGHQLSSALCSRSYMEKLRTPYEIVSLVFAAGAIVAAAGRPSSGAHPRHDLVELALQWLRRERPRIALNTPAGHALDDFAQKPKP